MKNNYTFECIKGVLFFRINDINKKEMLLINNMIRKFKIRNIVLNFSYYNKKNYILIKKCLYFVRKNKGLLVVCGSIYKKSYERIIIVKNELEALKEFI